METPPDAVVVWDAYDCNSAVQKGPESESSPSGRIVNMLRRQGSISGPWWGAVLNMAESSPNANLHLISDPCIIIKGEECKGPMVQKFFVASKTGSKMSLTKTTLSPPTHTS